MNTSRWRTTAIQDLEHCKSSPSEIINLTQFENTDLYSPKLMYASGALAALAIGFGAAAAATWCWKTLPSDYPVANLRLSLATVAAALTLRLAAKRIEALPGHLHDALPDRNQAASLDYSIIIPVFNRPEHIRALLARLAALYADGGSLGSGEIVVVDDGSTDKTAATAAELGRSMPIPTRVVSKQNGGVSSARNWGFSAARGNVCVVIDSDCLPEPDWLPSMLKAVRNDPKLLVFSQIRSAGRIAYPLENMPDSKGFAGASYAMKRIEYLRIGGCYERYGASHDDRDLVLTALAEGFRVGHVRDAWVEHPLRRESIRSMWKVGLNSRYGNLLAARHGIHAAPATRPTPYYFFGVGSNYGTSIAMTVGFANVALSAYLLAARPALRGRIASSLVRASSVIVATYCGALAALGFYKGARIREIPLYVAIMSTFHLSTFVGRLRGSLDYGLLLL